MRAKWTCGECGESYEVDSVVADSNVNRWARDHREAHRVSKLAPAARQKHYEDRLAALARSLHR